ncbi:MAG: acylneuraminate cytidylyltransferase family protein [Chloroflexi bacterium]|nr:acylneuraminate cytidylyltransferase family protein [Chloroflexota bacterium]
MAKDTPTIIALIPARSGSQRVPHKNIRPLGGHPLMAYSIAAAVNSGVFSEVLVSTDSEKYADIARHYGASVPFLRPNEYAESFSPDIEFVEHALNSLRDQGREYDCFSILRPTSPFRKAETIQRAWSEFLAQEGVDSLRAVEKCNEHPCKMWVVRGERMMPLIPFGPTEQPWHSSQYPTLPEVYVQNASLEIAWTRVVTHGRTIAGNVLMPFITVNDEGLDVNTEYDWMLTNQMLATGDASLPPISQSPYPLDD